MANSTETIKFWMDGLPVVSVNVNNDTNSLKFWADGLPAEVIFEPVTSVPIRSLLLLLGVG